MSFTLSSAAKINVFLEVIGKRSDGFHELETVMLRTDFCDTLHFAESESSDVRLSLSTDSVVPTDQFPLDESNLILKAAAALRRATKCSRGASISVDKMIPAEAGLAGGSSNAATTLIGLNRLWNLQLPKEQMHEIAASLGSDINFFIEDCSAAVCRGRGELVSPIPIGGHFYFVAVRPPLGNSTPEIFSRLSYNHSPRTSDSVVVCLRDGNVSALSGSIFNRLTEPGRECNSPMSLLLDSMATLTGKNAFMSGSGSTCFTVADSQQEAVKLEQLLLTENLGTVFRFAT